jgi:hypothetical protein
MVILLLHLEVGSIVEMPGQLLELHPLPEQVVDLSVKLPVEYFGLKLAAVPIEITLEK